MAHSSAHQDIFLGFSTPLLRQVIPETEGLNRELSKIILDRAATESSDAISNVGGWQSNSNLFEWPQPEIGRVGELAVEAVKVMTNYTAQTEAFQGAVELELWANVSGPGDSNKPHSHPGSMWSGIYYVDPGTSPKPHPLSGVIEFMDPRPAVASLSVPGRPFDGAIQIKPEPGMLLLFPGWLVHFVNPYRGEGFRISMAFNANITRAGV